MKITSLCESQLKVGEHKVRRLKGIFKEKNMNINVNIDDYLDESEVKEIVKEELREAVSYQLRTNQSVDTCLTNISYRYVWDMVNDLYKEYDVDFEKCY